MNEYSLVLTQVMRGDEQVAEFNRETGQLDFLQDCARFRAPVVRWLKANNYAGETLHIPEAEKPKPAKKGTSDKPSVEELYAMKQKLQAAGMLPPDDPEAPKSITTGFPSVLDYIDAGQPLPIGRTMDLPPHPIKAKRYPGAPAFGSGGDKSPAFVDWLWENHPQDAAQRYAGRKTHRD